MKQLLYILFVISQLQHFISAQWQPDVRLTNNPFESFTSLNNARNVSSTGNLVHVLWHDDRDGNEEIYYKRSLDAGLTWGTDTRLTNNDTHSTGPSVFAIGQVVHAVWHDIRDGNFEIYYKRSVNSGGTWGTDTRLTVNSAVSTTPSVYAVTVTSHIVHLVWRDFRDGNDEIYYKRSTDGGTTWGADTRLTVNSSNSINPSVSVSGSVVNVVWYDNRDGNNEIYYKRSPDAGVTWGPDTRVTNNSSVSLAPTLTASGSNVYIVWWDNRDGNNEIYCKRSTDAGINWDPDMRLTNNTAQSTYPSVSASAQTVYVVWIDGRDGNSEVYYKRSTNEGISWESDTRLTINTALSDYPSVSVNGQAVHVVWRDSRDGNEEIYYKLNPTGTTVGIININSGIPEHFSLSQNYPNPFNPTTYIEFQIPQSGLINITIYDALGRKVETIVNQNLAAGTYKAGWDASNMVSGVYFYRLNTGDFTDTKKMILLK